MNSESLDKVDWGFEQKLSRCIPTKTNVTIMNCLINPLTKFTSKGWMQLFSLETFHVTLVNNFLILVRNSDHYKFVNSHR